jgi:ABC-type Fe3+/spermidine/putrescine transport system ATPase subunit
LYTSPSSKFEAQFLGEVNFNDGTVARGTGETIEVNVFGGLIRLRSTRTDLKEGQRCVVATRPESWIIGNSKDNKFSAGVIGQTYLGGTVHINVNISDQRVDIAALNPGNNFDLPAQCEVSIDSKDVILLPVE